MSPSVTARLLALNRAFYAQAGAAFDATRQNIPPGMVRVVENAPAGQEGAPLRVLDVGCGNGRLARALATLRRPVAYTGADADAGLLDAAARQTLPLAAAGVACAFVPVDLAAPGWEAAFAPGGYDLVACLATLHHLPGRALRGDVVRALAARVAPGGRLALSAWQFADSPRLAARTAPWECVGLSRADVEPGDALLPWQESGLLRYVHQLNLDEMATPATAAGLQMLAPWRADGRSGDLALYTLFERA